MAPSVREQRRAEQDAAVARALREHPDSLDAQLDAIAGLRDTYHPGTPQDRTLNAYLAGSAPLAATVDALADPIDAAYSAGTKHSGNSSSNKNDDTTSCEVLLWGLWFAILHAARKRPYLSSSSDGSGSGAGKDSAASSSSPQQPLLRLVAALKARPDPPRPDPLPVELAADWVWEPGTLWSALHLLGPSAREAWNDAPGGGMGVSEPEKAGWEHVNAFVAALSREDLSDFWLYGVWALRDALESEGGAVAAAGVDPVQVCDANVRAAAAWIRVAGREIRGYVLENEDEDAGDGEVVAVDAKMADMPWYRTTDYTRARWRFWREKFGVLAKRSTLLEETRKLAGDMAVLMSQIEQELTE